MAISKTKISKRIEKKTDKDLVKTLITLKKNNVELAKLLSVPKRKRKAFNLQEIAKQIKDEKVVIVPGKVLGEGTLDKKVKIIALSFSGQAEEKLKEAKIEFQRLDEAIKENNKLEGKILR